MKKYLILGISLLSFLSTYSQTNILKGKITYQGIPIPDAIIIIPTNDTLRLVSDVHGEFVVTSIKEKVDSIKISAYKDGFVPIENKIFDISEMSNINLAFTEQVSLLPEIVISANKNSIHKVSKTIYKIDEERFLKNAKADAVLNNIPNLSFVNGNLLFNNRKDVTIYMDGIISSIDDLKDLDIKDIAQIEIISNPAAEYGTEIKGSVINVVKRQRRESFLKGELSVGKKNRLNGFNTNPSFAYKNKWMMLNTRYFYTVNNQNIESDIKRIYNENEDSQHIIQKLNGWQDYFSTRMNFNILSNLNIFVGSSINRYQFDSHINTISINDKNSYRTQEKLTKKDINGVLNYALSKNANITIRGRHFDYNNKDTYYDKGNEVISKINENSSEILYIQKNISLFGFKTNMTAGYKYINRHNKLNEIIYKQNLNLLYSNWELEINNSLSTFLSFSYENTYNKGIDSIRNYHNWLPVFSILYKKNNNVTIEFSYSNKLTRPSANYLNPNKIFINPMHILKGNPQLLPQSTHNIELNISRSIREKHNIGLHSFLIIHNDMITECYQNFNTSLITSYANIGKAYSFGENISLFSKLGSNVTVNFNIGFDYTSLTTSKSQIIENNKGFSYNNNFNLYAINKYGWALNFNCNYRSRFYSLTQKIEQKPLLTLSIEKNLLKDKATISLYYLDFLNSFSKTKGYIASSYFKQYSSTKSSLSSISILFTYRFGKKFNSRMNNGVINNDDINIK